MAGRAGRAATRRETRPAQPGRRAGAGHGDAARCHRLAGDAGAKGVGAGGLARRSLPPAAQLGVDRGIPEGRRTPHGDPQRRPQHPGNPTRRGQGPGRAAGGPAGAARNAGRLAGGDRRAPGTARRGAREGPYGAVPAGPAAPVAGTGLAAGRRGPRGLARGLAQGLADGTRLPAGPAGQRLGPLRAAGRAAGGVRDAVAQGRELDRGQAGPCEAAGRAPSPAGRRPGARDPVLALVLCRCPGGAARAVRRAAHPSLVARAAAGRYAQAARRALPARRDCTC
jgi:hypothetical protein